MLIVLESIDGGGKGAQRQKTTEKLKSQLPNSIIVEGLEFPFKGEPISIYNYLIHDALHNKTKLNNESWFLAFLLEKTLMKESLEKARGNSNYHLICDGYFTTTLVYQSLVDSAIPLKDALYLGDFFKIPKADLNLFLDVDVEVALNRKLKEPGHDEGLDRNEGDIDKQKKIAESFRYLVEKNIWGEWSVVDGNGTLDEVNELILQKINKIL